MPVEDLQGLASETISRAVEGACKRIPPLWPLQNFVAVNPFLGMTDRSFREAAVLMDVVGHGPMLMPGAYYAKKYQAGAINDAQIAAAYTECTGLPAPQHAAAWLQAELGRNGEAAHILTVADWVDHTQGTNWSGFVTDEISKWCASYFDRAQSQWEMPGRGGSLYAAWKSAASMDLNPEVYGLRGFRALVRGLPDDEEAAIAELLFLLGAADEVEDFLHRELMSIFGWSAWCAYRERQAGGEKVIRQLLAIRLAYDAALLAVAEGYDAARRIAGPASFTTAKYVAQVAAEGSFRSGIAAKLAGAEAARSGGARKRLQAVFCIDVRSTLR